MKTLGLVLRRLALICVGISFDGSAALARELTAIPERALADVAEESERDEEWRPDDRVHLLDLLSRDCRVAVRATIARSVSAKPPPWGIDLERVIARLAADPSASVRLHAAEALSAVLVMMAPLDRTITIAEWATDSLAAKRLALARCLAADVAAVGADLALCHLAMDPDEAVRRAAHESLRILGRNGDHAAYSSPSGPPLMRS